MTQRVHSRTLRGPKAVTSHPFRIVPKIDPTPRVRVSRACISRGEGTYRRLVRGQFAMQRSKSNPLGSAPSQGLCRRIGVGRRLELLAGLCFMCSMGHTVSKKVPQKISVVTFHDDDAGDSETPQDGLLVDLNSLANGHVLLFEGGILGDEAQSTISPFLLAPTALKVAVGFDVAKIDLHLLLLGHGEIAVSKEVVQVLRLG